MRLDFLLGSLLLVPTACSGGLSPSVPAHGVEVVATAIRRAAGGDSVTIRITNVGSQQAFLSRCGDGPLILVEQFVGGTWTGGVQNFACLAPTAPGPVALGPAASISSARIFDLAGRYRFRVPVATTEDLRDAAPAESNAFDIP